MGLKIVLLSLYIKKKMETKTNTYSCEPCNFETGVKCNFERHMGTKKHLDKIMIQPPATTTIVADDKAPLDMSWAGQVARFEKTHCKIINKGLFIKSTDNEYIIMNESLLKTAYGHMHYLLPKKDDDGVFLRYEKKSFIKRWLSHTHNIRFYLDMGLYPPPMICPPTIFNMWKPFAMDRETKSYVKYAEGLQAFLNHIDILCNHQKEVADIIIKWIAQMVQYPAVKTIMPTFFGGQGGGKTSLFEWLKPLLGKDKVFETTEPSRDVWGNFNELMATSFLVVLSELSKKETMESEARIKALVTDAQITINKKGISAVQLYSCHRFAATTNNPDTITTKEGDRRNLIIKCSDEKKGDSAYFDKLREYMNNYNTCRTIWDYLKAIPNMDKFGSIPLPKTEHQQNLKAVYRSVPDLWLEHFTRQNLQQASVKLLGLELYAVFKEWCSQGGYRFETNISKLLLALITLDITCLTTRKKAIGESKHTNKGE